MADYREAFPGKFLRADDLGSRRPIVTIDAIDYEEVQGSGKKLVVRFVGKEKGLVLNVTNAQAIAEIVGDEDTDAWVGRKIQLYVDRNVTYQGKRVSAVRVEAPASVRKPLPPPPPPDEDEVVDEEPIPF